MHGYLGKKASLHFTYTDIWISVKKDNNYRAVLLFDFCSDTGEVYDPSQGLVLGDRHKGVPM